MKSIFYVSKELTRKTVKAKINEAHSEVAICTCSAKKIPLKISENSHEKTCWSLFINKVAGILQLS